jgi:hypothetical protein
MIEPGPGKMLNNTYRIGVPYFLHREMACSLNHEGRRTLTTTLSGTAVESFLASLSPSLPPSQEGVSDSRDVTYGCLIYYNAMMARNLSTLLRLCCVSGINRKVMGNGVSTAKNCSAILKKTASPVLAASDTFRRPPGEGLRQGSTMIQHYTCAIILCRTFLALSSDKWCLSTSHANSKEQAMPINPIRDEMATAGDVKLHFVQWGEQGPPIVCVHGLTANAFCFQAFASSTGYNPLFSPR